MDFQGICMTFKHVFVLSLLKLGSGQLQVIGPENNFQVSVGEDVVFSCYLSPKTSAETMEVRFFKDQFSAVIHHYRHGEDQDYRHMDEYKGRTELMKDSIADGLVSLRLTNITVLDAGIYGCWFRSQTYNQAKTWELQVSALGSFPLVSIMGYVGGDIKLICKSSGWFPKPIVTWKSSEGHNLSSDFKVKTNAQGLFDVESSFTLHKNVGIILCSIQNPEQGQNVESRIWIKDTFFQPSLYRALFISLILICLILLVSFIGMMTLYFKVIGKIKTKLESKRKHEQAELKNAKKYAERLTLDPDSAHPQLYISNGNVVTYKELPQDVPDLEKRFGSKSVVTIQGFQEGKHYWEVEVGHNKKWILGVCHDDMDRRYQLQLSPNNGYWVLGVRNKYDYFVFMPNRITFSLKHSPTRIGVFLNLEDRTVSFYDVNNQILIYTLTYQFKGLLRPYIQLAVSSEENVVPIKLL